VREGGGLGRRGGGGLPLLAKLPALQQLYLQVGFVCWTVRCVLGYHVCGGQRGGSYGGSSLMRNASCSALVNAALCHAVLLCCCAVQNVARQQTTLEFGLSCLGPLVQVLQVDNIQLDTQVCAVVMGEKRGGLLFCLAQGVQRQVGAGAAGGQHPARHTGVCSVLAGHKEGWGAGFPWAVWQQVARVK
jgi:hypothetical protein